MLRALPRRLGGVFALSVLTAATTLAQDYSQAIRDQQAVIAKHLSGSALTAPLKDSISARMRKIMAADMPGAQRFRQLQDLESLATNTEITLRDAEDLNTRIGRSPLALPLQNKFLALVAHDRHFLPASWELYGRTVRSIDADFRGTVDVYNLLQQFRSTVNSKGTKPLKATANKRLDQALAQFTTNPDGNKSILDQTQRPLEQLLGLLEAYDLTKARLAKDAPAQYPEFVANTLKEVDALREQVGDPAFPSDMSPLNTFEMKSYLVRKDWLVQAAEIQKRTVTTNIADPNVASNGMYRARLNLLLPHLVDYHSKNAEPGALKALWQEVVNRDHRQGKP